MHPTLYESQFFFLVPGQQRPEQCSIPCIVPYKEVCGIAWASPSVEIKVQSQCWHESTIPTDIGIDLEYQETLSPQTFAL
jgi:hypothetical protein